MADVIIFSQGGGTAAQKIVFADLAGCAWEKMVLGGIDYHYCRPPSLTVYRPQP